MFLKRYANEGISPFSWEAHVSRRVSVKSDSLSSSSGNPQKLSPITLFDSSNVYEDLSKSSNLVVGTVSTLLLGPIGLLGFLVKKKSGTVDYGISFENDRGRKKTAFIRFKNMKAAGEMAKELPELLKSIAGE